MEKVLEYIKGVTFGYLTPRGKYAVEGTKDSLRKMVEETAANTVILTVTAWQRSPHVEEVLYKGKPIPENQEVLEMIQFAKSLGLRVILKPVINCMDGTWRAHINFFDHEVPCEPKWSNWFRNYGAYILNFAEVAQIAKCDMFMIGCELVQTERRENEWRELIRQVRERYTGCITYSTDKYQEGQLKWWDAVDVIASSGFYPINTWDEQLERIYKVVQQYQKPFFFAEVGCMSCEGASLVPNDWTLVGKLNLQEQVKYYEVMFEKCYKHSWIRGFGLCSWDTELYRKELGVQDAFYCLYGKPAIDIVKAFYSKTIK